MPAYLGEEPVAPLAGTPFDGFDAQEWALHFIGCYGGIDGAHHKQWVLDQVARILHGTPVEVALARWADGRSEYRVSTGAPSADYLSWVESQKGDRDENGESEYGYDEGIAP